MTHIISVSGGDGSALAAERVIERFGIEHCLMVFADTNAEHPDLYALIRFMQKRYPARLVWLENDGTDIWDQFDASGIIRTPTGACKASLELKHKPIAQYLADNYSPDDAVLYTGLEFSESFTGPRGEPSRQKRFGDRWAPYRVEHPLNWEPRLSACDIHDAVRALGYPSQSLYEKGYPHNNCGGGCVLAGLGQWHGLYLDDPVRFAYHERREAQFNRKHRTGRKPFTVLRDQSEKAVATEQEDGTTTIERKRKVTPLTLKRFRERIEANDQTLNLRDFRSTCGCMHAEQGNLFEALGVCF